MEDLIKKLEKACEELELITELTRKYKNSDIVADKLLHKQIEDGILAKLHLANLYQLNYMKRNYDFRYYGKDLAHKLIDIQIVKTTRKEKLEKINLPLNL
jgi:hypothetical protein